MRPEDKIYEKYGKDSGMKVPENYFNSLNASIMEKLPPYQKELKAPEISSWQRFKPYIYLAAMFCGIWLMMKVFHTATQPFNTSLENPPAALVQILNEELDEELQFLPSGPDLTIEEEVIMNYDSIEEFQEDFGYILEPEYSANISYKPVAMVS